MMCAKYTPIYTCNIRMSKRPRNTVTDTMRSKTVLYRSADVLQHIATTRAKTTEGGVPNRKNAQNLINKR